MLLCAKYILPVTSEAITDGAVRVIDNKITDIGLAETLKARYHDDEVHDYGLSALMPGLINLHVHLESAVLRGIVPDAPYAGWVHSVMRNSAKMDKRDRFDSAVYGGLEALSSGITCLADITSSGASAHACQQLGLRGVIYREVSALDKGRVKSAMNSAHDDLMEWQSKVNSSKITLGIGAAPAFALHPSVYRESANYAIENDIPMSLRLAASKEEYMFIARGSSAFSITIMEEKRGYVEIPPWLPTGVSPVQYVLNWGGLDADQVLAVHCVKVDEKDIRTLKSREVSIATCPRSNAQLGMGIAPTSEFLRSGLCVGLGSDSPAATASTDLFTEMHVGMMLQRASSANDFVTPSTMLEMATIKAARALRLDNKIGSLEISKDADIIAVDLSGTYRSHQSDPVATIINTCTGSDVSMTMVAGEILYEKNRWNVAANVAKNIARIIEIRRKLKG